MKLPLGIHKKTGKRTKFITHQLKKMKRSYHYFLTIQPMNKEDFNHIMDEAMTLLDVRTLEKRTPENLEKRLIESKKEFSDIKPPNSQSSSLRQKAERLLHEGIREEDLAKGTGRHALQFFVILYFKEEGYSEGEAYERTLQWAFREKNKGMVESDDMKIRRDIKKNVRQIYKNDIGMFDSQGREFELYKNDLIVAGSFKRRTTRKVVLAILLIGRIFHCLGNYKFSNCG
ncbi:hypothetical protein [Evansella tamaricis]|uniref:Uncharacterized protein n=1 Tax=Evansella tamaricis TaxID=2069301 RepID=A0ABS6JCH2_9BACI|nr:hypothetical protein [Evansella tamaricis]MBU9711370.1 hypothetical protein [Evansella tamaricis]